MKKERRKKIVAPKTGSRVLAEIGFEPTLLISETYFSQLFPVFGLETLTMLPAYTVFFFL